MAGDGEDSVTRWISDVRAGDRGEAPRLLWDRYFQRLARLAQTRLRTRGGAPADGEDVALSALDTFIRGAAAGRYPGLSDREDLWRLLVTITARKAHNLRRDAGRKKRGGGRVLAGAALAANDGDGEDFLAQVVGKELTPELTAIMADEYRRLFGGLDDESLLVVAVMKLEGHSNEEIARALDCALRTVERKLDEIRKRWTAEAAS
jgi:DNA-directed RNA polymerase specialized sigma24 family protein